MVQEKEVARLCVAMAVAEACSRQWKSMMWRLVGSSNPETNRFEQTDVIVKDFGRHYAVAARVWLRSSVSSRYRMRLRFGRLLSTLCHVSGEFLPSASASANHLHGKSVTCFLKECASQQHETAIVARATGPRGSQIARALDVHFTPKWIDATKGPQGSRTSSIWSTRDSGMSAEGL